MNIKKDLGIADLRWRVNLLFPGKEVRDSEGNRNTEQGETVKVWAYVEAYTAQSTDRNGEQINEVRYNIAIRYREGVTKETAVEYDGRKLENSAPPVETDRKKWLQMDCREVIA